MTEKPYWFPALCDAEYIARLRVDYPEHAEKSDEELHDYFNHGLKYQNLWDHVGDAYGDYEPLADSYLEILTALKACHAVLAAQVEAGTLLATEEVENAAAAIANAEGSAP